MIFWILWPLLAADEVKIDHRQKRTYAPVAKVDVKFAATNREEELPIDRIVQISRPYICMVFRRLTDYC